MTLLVSVKTSQICISWGRVGEAGAATKSERSKLLTSLSLDPSILHLQYTGRPNSATQSNETSVYPPPTCPASPSLSMSRSPRPVKQGYFSPNDPPPRRQKLAYYSSYGSQDGFSSENSKKKGRCTYPNCGKFFEDLKAHMLTHQNDHPGRIPLQPQMMNSARIPVRIGGLGMLPLQIGSSSSLIKRSSGSGTSERAGSGSCSSIPPVGTSRIGSELLPEHLMSGNPLSQIIGSTGDNSDTSFQELRDRGSTRGTPERTPTPVQLSKSQAPRKSNDVQANSISSSTMFHLQSTSSSHKGPPLCECHYKPCPYRSEHEFNCKQHMEKAHGWVYQRSKNNGKNRPQKATGTNTNNGLPTPTITNIQTPSSDANTVATPEDDNYDMQPPFDGLPMYGNQLNFPEYSNNTDMDMFAPHQLQLDYSPISDLNPPGSSPPIPVLSSSKRPPLQQIPIAQTPMRGVPQGNMRSDQMGRFPGLSPGAGNLGQGGNPYGFQQIQMLKPSPALQSPRTFPGYATHGSLPSPQIQQSPHQPLPQLGRAGNNPQLQPALQYSGMQASMLPSTPNMYSSMEGVQGYPPPGLYQPYQHVQHQFTQSQFTQSPVNGSSGQRRGTQAGFGGHVPQNSSPIQGERTSGTSENAGSSTYSFTNRDPLSEFDDEPLLFDDQGQLWWRAFTELQKEIPETQLHKAWVDAHLKTDARRDIVARTAINTLIIALEGMNKALLLRGLSPLKLAPLQQILDIAKIVQSTLDFKTGGFIWTCLSNVVSVSLSFPLIQYFHP
jgi:hypothetical protein